MSHLEPISWECARYYNGKWKAGNTILYRLYTCTYVTEKPAKVLLRSVSKSEFEHACATLGIKFQEV